MILIELSGADWGFIISLEIYEQNTLLYLSWLLLEKFLLPCGQICFDSYDKKCIILIEVVLSLGHWI